MANVHIAVHEVLDNNRPQSQEAGFSVGWVSALDDYGRTVWIIDAHRDGKRFVVRADEKVTAFLELESVVRAPRNQLQD